MAMEWSGDSDCPPPLPPTQWRSSRWQVRVSWARLSPLGQACCESRGSPLPCAFDGDFISLTPRSLSHRHRGDFHSRSTVPFPWGLSGKGSRTKNGIVRSGFCPTPLSTVCCWEAAARSHGPFGDLTREGVGLSGDQTPFRVQMA